MIPASVSRSMTNNAPTFLDDIYRMASNTVLSGVTDQISRPLRSKMALMSPMTFIAGCLGRARLCNYTTN